MLGLSVDVSTRDLFIYDDALIHANGLGFAGTAGPFPYLLLLYCAHSGFVLAYVCVCTRVCVYDSTIFSYLLFIHDLLLINLVSYHSSNN